MSSATPRTGGSCLQARWSASDAARRHRGADARATGSAASSASVEVDGLLARVEIDVTEPARVVAIVTRESVEELGLAAGHERRRRGQVDERDGGAVTSGSGRRSPKREQAAFSDRVGRSFAGAAVGRTLAAELERCDRRRSGVVRTSGLRRQILLADFYGSAAGSRADSAPLVRPTLRRGRSASNLQARALTGQLLTGAGDTPATAEDFTFEWPTPALATAAATSTDGADRAPHRSRGPPERRRDTSADVGTACCSRVLPRASRSRLGALALPGAGVELVSRCFWISVPRAPCLSAYLGPRGTYGGIVLRCCLFALVFAVYGVLLGASARSTATPPLTIYAAASLTDVFRTFDSAQNYSFAGSNALETQIRNGAPADIFASAAPLNTQRLFRAGLVEKAGHVHREPARLDRPEVESEPGSGHVYDLRSKPVKLVVAAPAVPVGGYTITVLRKMGLSGRAGQGRQPRVGRQGRDGQGRARAGRRRVRLRHGRTGREATR